MWSRRPDMSGPRRSRRRWVALAALAAAGLAVWQLWPGRSDPARAGVEVPVHPARVVRTDVATRQLVPGTLGYGSTFPVVDQLLGGTVTWVPAPGNVVRGGRTLYRVDDQPVTLLYGPVPAWRSFELGMTPGSDVRELERNLASLGFDRDHRMTVDDHFTWATAAAIDRWQRSRGMPQIGALSPVRSSSCPARSAWQQSRSHRELPLSPAASSCRPPRPSQRCPSHFRWARPRPDPETG
jgi:hypothetical protein